MKAKKKNKFLTFCFSCMPGAGEMYMGFLKTGLSLMSIFLFSIVVLGVLQFEEFAVVVGVTVWFYSFFHANHLASLSDEEFAEIKDGFLFGEDAFAGYTGRAKKYQKVIAGLLIAAGVILLWNTATDIARNFLPEYLWKAMAIVGDYVPRIAVAVLIMIAGVKMICGRKAQLAQEEVVQTLTEVKEETPQQVMQTSEEASEEA